jgi:hypothetical protein
LIIGIYNFDIIYNLIIAIWDFSALSGKVNRFYLNQLEMTLTLPCQQSPFLDTLTGFEYTFFQVVSWFIHGQNSTDGTSCHLEKSRPGAWQPDGPHDFGTRLNHFVFNPQDLCRQLLCS